MAAARTFEPSHDLVEDQNPFLAPARTYADFEPSHNLVEDASKETLVINLPGFKKEHLRVQIDNYGRLRISGERPVEGSLQWSRFRKEFHVPVGCDAAGIRARFEKDGVLRVTMPRLTPLEEDLKAAADAAAAAAAAEEKKRHEEIEEEDSRKRRAAEEEDHAGDEGEGAHQETSAGRQAYGFVRDRSRSRMVRAMLLAVAVALVGVAGMYARYRWMDPSAEMLPADDANVGFSDY